MRLKNLTLAAAMLAVSCAACAQTAAKSVEDAFRSIIYNTHIDVVCIKNERGTDPYSANNKLLNLHRVYEFNMKVNDENRALINQVREAIDTHTSEFYWVEEKCSPRQSIPDKPKDMQVEYTTPIEPFRVYYGTELESEVIGTMQPRASEAGMLASFSHHVMMAHKKDPDCVTCRYNYTMEWIEFGNTIRGRLYELYAVLPDLGIATSKKVAKSSDDSDEPVYGQRSWVSILIPYPDEPECSAFEVIRDIARKEGVEEQIFFNGAIMLGSLLSAENGRTVLSREYTFDEIINAIYDAADQTTAVRDAYNTYLIAMRLKGELLQGMGSPVKIMSADQCVRQRFGKEAIDSLSLPTRTINIPRENKEQLFDMRPIRIDKTDKYHHAQQNATTQMMPPLFDKNTKASCAPCYSYAEACGTVEAFLRQKMTEHGIDIIRSNGCEVLDLKALKERTPDIHALTEQVLDIYENSETPSVYLENYYLTYNLVQSLFDDDGKSKEFFSRRLKQQDNWQLKNLKKEQLQRFNGKPVRYLWVFY